MSSFRKKTNGKSNLCPFGRPQHFLRILKLSIFKKKERIQSIQIERSALAAIQFLQYFNHSNNKNLPELIILNLDLPGKEGIQLLGVIKEFVSHNSCPVKIIATRNRGLVEEINEENKNYLITYIHQDRLLNYLSEFSVMPYFK